MEQPSSEPVSILCEVDLGQHTLMIMSDGSVNVLANDEQTPYLAENALCLDRDEAYRLFICLQEQFRQEGETVRQDYARGNSGENTVEGEALS